MQNLISYSRSAIQSQPRRGLASQLFVFGSTAFSVVIQELDRAIEKGQLGKTVGRVQWEVPSPVMSFIAWIAGRFMLLRMRKLLGHHVPSRLG